MYIYSILYIYYILMYIYIYMYFCLYMFIYSKMRVFNLHVIFYIIYVLFIYILFITYIYTLYTYIHRCCLNFSSDDIELVLVAIQSMQSARSYVCVMFGYQDHRLSFMKQVMMKYKKQPLRISWIATYLCICCALFDGCVLYSHGGICYHPQMEK